MNAPLPIRPITEDDHEAVLALNDLHVDLLAPLDHARLRRMLAWADHGEVIEHEGRFAGFVLTFGPGTAYDSENYRWFADNYEDFYYLDRIVLAEPVRRLGLGRRTYEHLEAVARPHGRMALEVNVDPPNHASLAFHRGRGYQEVGRRHLGGHEVVLMVRELGED